MKTLVYSLFALVLFSACQEVSEKNEALTRAITSFETDPSLQNYNQLVLIANEQMITNGQPQTSTILTTLEAILSAGKAEAAQEWLWQILRDHSDFDGREKVLLAYADVWEKNLKKPTQASIIRQGIFQTHPELPGLQEYRPSIEKLPPAQERLKGFAQKMFADSTGAFNPKVAASFVPACENFALSQPADSLSPVFLIDAATIARNLNQTKKVLELFKWVYEKYPESPKAGDAKFSEAFTFDNDLKDFDRAKVAYETFLSEYPEHPFVASAKVMLKNLGKSDEQIIRELEAASKTAE
jgi:tetratricopeptide (TPR) repeat protein